MTAQDIRLAERDRIYREYMRLLPGYNFPSDSLEMRIVLACHAAFKQACYPPYEDKEGD